MADEIERPANLRLSEVDSTLVANWSLVATNYLVSTQTLCEALSYYATNAIEFNLLGPEIRYLLSRGLDIESQEILASTNALRGGSIAARTADETRLMRCRQVILRKIRNLFYRLRNECYPTLIERFVPPPPASITAPSAVLPTLIRVPRPAIDLTESKDEDHFPEEIINDHGEDSGSTIEVPPMANLMLEDVTVNNGAERALQALTLLSDILAALTGIVCVFHDFDSFTSTFLHAFTLTPLPLCFPPPEGVSFDFVICMPPANIQLEVLTYCIDHRLQFLLYIRLSILNEYKINYKRVRLNMYITGSCAWLIGNFPERLSGNGGQFKLCTL